MLTDRGERRIICNAIRTLMESVRITVHCESHFPSKGRRAKLSEVQAARNVLRLLFGNEFVHEHINSLTGDDDMIKLPSVDNASNGST